MRRAACAAVILAVLVAAPAAAQERAPGSSGGPPAALGGGREPRRARPPGAQRRAAEGPPADRRPRRRARRPRREGAARAARVPGRDARGLPQGRRPLAGLLLRQDATRCAAQGDRAGARRRPPRARARGVDRLPGAVVDGARLSRRVRADRQRPVGLDPAGRAVRGAVPAPAVGDAPARPARAERVLGVAGVLQRRADRRVRPARLSAARVPARAHARDRAAPPGRRRAGAPAAARCSCRSAGWRSP